MKMGMSFLRTCAGACLALCSVTSYALGTVTVTSPSSGDFVGSSTTIRFNIDNATVAVKVKVTVSKVGGGPSTNLPEQTVTPDSNGDGSGQVTWAPGTSFPEGDYNIQVDSTEGGVPLPSTALVVTLDRKKPELTSFAPTNGSFVKGTVNISATIQEVNLDTWRVTVNGEDLPNNTGSTNSVVVSWDTSGIENDGAQSIAIIVKDKANNEKTVTISVTLDRAAPTVQVNNPRVDQQIRPGSTMGVIVDVTDASTTSVDIMAIQVEIQKLDGTFIKRVSRSRFGPQGSALRWQGKVKVTLPAGVTQFKVVVRVFDKAGNGPVIQEVQLRLGQG